MRIHFVLDALKKAHDKRQPENTAVRHSTPVITYPVPCFLNSNSIFLSIASLVNNFLSRTWKDIVIAGQPKLSTGPCVSVTVPDTGSIAFTMPEA